MSDSPGLTRPPTVLLVVADFPNASETFIVRPAAGLLARGWNVHVACENGLEAAWALFEDSWPAELRAGRIHTGMALPALLDQLAPDLIHIEYLHRARRIVGLLPYTPVATPVIVSIRGDYPMLTGIDDETAYGPVWERATLVHAVSHATLAVAHGRGLPRSIPTTVIPSGTDLSHFVAPDRTFGPLGTPARPLRIVTIARMQWKKGLEYALLAIRGLLDGGVECRWDLYGDGPMMDRVQYTVRDLGLDAVVTLHGAVSREVVRDALAQADALLHTSVSEGLPNVLVEAQAMGVPVVCTDAGGSGEAVEDGVTGFVVPRRDARALADRLEALAHDAALRARMSAAGPEWARTGFSAEASLDATEAMYREVIALSGRPDRTVAPVRDTAPTAAETAVAPMRLTAPLETARPDVQAGTRILLVTGRFPQPTETFLAAKVVGLLQRGWDVRVAASEPSQPEWHRFFPALAQVGWRPQDLLVGPIDADLVRAVDPALVHLELAVHGPVWAASLASAGPPLVTTLRGSDMRTVGLGDGDHYAGLWPHLAFVESRSEDLWQIAQRRGCPPEMPHAVIRTGVDVEAFAVPDRRYDGPIGGQERPVRILSVGRLDWKKGYPYALHALRLLLDRGIDCRLTIVGDGPRINEVRYCARDLRLEEAVEFAGLLDRSGVIAGMRQADLLLHASVSEGVPNAVIEAQAAGLPVVASDVGGTREGVEVGQSALLVPSRDPRALADAVAQVAADGALRRRMGEAGVAFVREHFSLERYLDRTEEIYRQVLANA